MAGQAGSRAGKMRHTSLHERQDAYRHPRKHVYQAADGKGGWLMAILAKHVGLYTDHYELAMAQGYLLTGMQRTTACFDSYNFV